MPSNIPKIKRIACKEAACKRLTSHPNEVVRYSTDVLCAHDSERHDTKEEDVCGKDLKSFSVISKIYKEYNHLSGREPLA